MRKSMKALKQISQKKELNTIKISKSNVFNSTPINLNEIETDDKKKEPLFDILKKENKFLKQQINNLSIKNPKETIYSTITLILKVLDIQREKMLEIEKGN